MGDRNIFIATLKGLFVYLGRRQTTDTHGPNTALFMRKVKETVQPDSWVFHWKLCTFIVNKQQISNLPLKLEINHPISGRLKEMPLYFIINWNRQEGKQTEDK